MFTAMNCFIILLNIGVVISINLNASTRRIMWGWASTKENAPYVVSLREPYFPARERYYDWGCVGAIASAKFVLTSAACLLDVNEIVVISGTFNIPVLDALVEKKCVTDLLRAVRAKYVPQGYDLKYDSVKSWTKFDIGLARVDRDFDFTIKGCHFAPAPQIINYAEGGDLSNGGTKANVHGWGSEDLYREDGSHIRIHIDDLKYSGNFMYNIHKCSKYFQKEMQAVIVKYMLCTYGGTSSYGETEGNNNRRMMTYNRRPIINKMTMRNNSNSQSQVKKRKPVPSRPKQVKAVNGTSKTTTTTAATTTIDTTTIDTTTIDNTTTSRENSNERTVIDLQSKDEDDAKHIARAKAKGSADRSGFCQNDHGAPLVAPVHGARQIVGVASIALINEKNECVGPYLYTSTFMFANFIKCILSDFADTIACNEMDTKEYIILKTEKPWLRTTDALKDKNYRFPESPKENLNITAMPTPKENLNITAVPTPNSDVG